MENHFISTLKKDKDKGRDKHTKIQSNKQKKMLIIKDKQIYIQKNGQTGKNKKVSSMTEKE